MMRSTDNDRNVQLENPEASAASIDDVAQMENSETMVVKYQEPDDCPSVRVDGYGRIVIDNLPEPGFLVRMPSMPLPDCALKDVVRGLKRLSRYGDSKGRAAYREKLKRNEKVENRDYRVCLTYIVMLRRRADAGTLELSISFIRNAAGEAQYRSKPDSDFAPMDDEQINEFVRMFTTKASVKIQDIISEEYARAQSLGVDPDYYNLPSLNSD